MLNFEDFFLGIFIGSYVIRYDGMESIINNDIICF